MSMIPKALQYSPSLDVRGRQTLTCTHLVKTCEEIPYCDECILEANREFLEAGVIPPNALFPLTRLAHVADSCVNCGLCEDACPMELPLSKLFSLLNSKLTEVFDYMPGVDLDQGIPLNTAMAEEMNIEDVFLDVSSLTKSIKKK